MSKHLIISLISLWAQGDGRGRSMIKSSPSRHREYGHCLVTYRRVWNLLLCWCSTFLVDVIGQIIFCYSWTFFLFSFFSVFLFMDGFLWSSLWLISHGKYDSDMITACVPNGFLANVFCQKLCNIVIHSDWCVWFQNFRSGAPTVWLCDHREICYKVFFISGEM
jgi:hypothetical protein